MTSVSPNLACTMAEEAVERLNKLPHGSAAKIVDGIVSGMTFPRSVQYVVALTIIEVGIDWNHSNITRSRGVMPEHWYAAVAATASTDGRFFVGRLLSGGRASTVGAALRFIAIERAVNSGNQAQSASSLRRPRSPEEAKAALVSYYKDNRTIADKAVTMAAGATSDAGSVASCAVKSAAFAIRHKLRVGF